MKTRGFPMAVLIFLHLSFLSLNFSLSADKPGSPGVEPERKEIEWTQVFQGVSFSENTTTIPRLQKIFILRIDMHEKGGSFFTTPRRPDRFEPGKNETVRQRTNEFLTQYQLQAAVNANFFAVPKGEAYARPGSSDLHGVAVSEGIVVSEPAPGCPVVFGIRKDGTPVIITAKEMSDGDLDELSTAVAGNVVLLEGGEIVPLSSEAVHPRTAVGISKDKRFVYLLVIDGRQNDYSLGATYAETAAWLRFYGASDGLNLDGGGSTTMVLRDREGQPRIVNRPSDQQPRYNGNNLGVRARPLSQSP